MPWSLACCRIAMMVGCRRCDGQMWGQRRLVMRCQFWSWRVCNKAVCLPLQLTSKHLRVKRRSRNNETCSKIGQSLKDAELETDRRKTVLYFPYQSILRTSPFSVPYYVFGGCFWGLFLRTGFRRGNGGNLLDLSLFSLYCNSLACPPLS